MKNKITLCLFAFLFATNAQIIEAQNINSINNSSLQKAKKLQNKIKFNDIVLQEIHQAYVEYDGKIASLNSLTKSNAGNNFGNKKHLIQIRLQKTIKIILKNDDIIFDKYLAATNQQNLTKRIERVKHSKTVKLIDKNPPRYSRRTENTPTKTVLLRERYK